MRNWLILGGLGAWLVCFPFLAASDAARKVDEYHQRLGSVNSKISATKKKLAVARRKERAATAVLYGTQKQLGQTRSSLGVTRSRLRSARGQLSKIGTELRRAESRLQGKRAALTHRLNEAYKHPPSSYMATLLSSGDTWSIMTRTKMIQQVVNADVRLLEDIRVTRDEIKRHEAAQKQKVAEIGTLERTLAARETQERHLAWQQEAQRREIAADRSQYERALDELLHESRRMTAMIRAMQSTPAGRKRMATVFNGNFIRPVSGRITSNYGMRYHPILKKNKMHTGVDFGAASGTSIRAAASGTVIVSGWMGAYGNAVVLDHGGGVSTLYGHCSSLSVRVGQEVRQGQVIAKVGSTGWSTGPHLHFEVRKNGTPVDPL